MSFFKKLLSVCYRDADFAIGGRDHPYLLRWFVIPRNRWFNIYLHKFCRDDDDRALHDHPWWFVSLVLWGRYLEWRPNTDSDFPLATHSGRWRYPLTIAFRRAKALHRIELAKSRDGDPLSCWSLVVTGPRIREWGFMCPQGWRHWRDFTAGKEGELVGRGCD